MSFRHDCVTDSLLVSVPSSFFQMQVLALIWMQNGKRYTEGGCYITATGMGRPKFRVNPLKETNLGVAFLCPPPPPPAKGESTTKVWRRFFNSDTVLYAQSQGRMTNSSSLALLIPWVRPKSQIPLLRTKANIPFFPLERNSVLDGVGIRNRQ